MSKCGRWNTLQIVVVAVAVATAVGRAGAQAAPGGEGSAPPGVLPGVKMGGSPNVHLVAHIPLGGFFRVEDDEIEQDASRPYAYLSQGRDRAGFTIIDLHDLDNVKVLYHWNIENGALHQGLGGMDGKYFKVNNRYYYIQSLQFSQGTPDADLGAVVADVTGLPDTSKVKIVARIHLPDRPGGIHNIFAYKHSDGHVYLFTTSVGATVLVFDAGKVVAGGDPAQWKVSEVTSPRMRTSSSDGPAIMTSTWPTIQPPTRTSTMEPVRAGTMSTTSRRSVRPSC